MKRLFEIALICLMPIFAKGQSQIGQSNYYSQMQTFDLSKLWCGDKLHPVGEDFSIDFPEPLGYIGDDFHRFYIHYITVKKDSINPHKYLVTGKTRVDNNICLFTGTIIISTSKLFKKSDSPKYKQGNIIANIYFKEDSTQKGSGFIKGKLTTDWCMNKNGMLFYDTINFVADGFSNNEVIGTWTSYKTRQTKKCNWGDFRIPESKGLDIGAGEFGVSDKYVKNGWLNYHNMDIGDAKAKVEEKRQWWK